MEATLIGPYGPTVLQPGTLSIGSAQDNQIIVVGDDVSPYHAQLRRETQGSNIVDMGSTAGTFVNGERLHPNVPRWLSSGDTVRIGNNNFTYQATDLPQAAGFSAAGTPPAKKRRRLSPLKIVGIVVAIIVVALGATIGIESATGSLPTKTANTFCNALKSHDAQTSYNQLTSGFRAATSFADWKTFQSLIQNCTVKSANDSSGDILLAYTYSYAPDKQFLVDVKTTPESYLSLFTWKIYYHITRYTPTFAITQFCYGTQTGDLALAYKQFSQSVQSKLPADQFASNAAVFKGVGCSTINADDNAATATTTTQFSSGFTLTYNYTFVQEKVKVDTATVNEARISSQVGQPNTNQTLYLYCASVISGDYATAYSLFDSNVQSQLSQSDFAASFTHKVTACQASNMDDNAGKGTITFTYDDNSTATLDFTVVNSNNTWLIDTIQQH